MRLLFDYQCFVNDRVGGISKYFTRVINHIHKDSENDVQIAGRYSNNLYTKDLLLSPKFKTFLPQLDFKGQRKVLKYINKVIAADKLQKGTFDIFHPTYYDPYFLNYVKGKRFVITVHDMIHEVFNIEEYFGKLSMLETKRVLLERSERVIAVSEFTKRDILRYIDISPDKIEVVHHGIDENYNGSTSTIAKNASQRYFLFVGRRSGYKNFLFMIKAIADLIKDFKINIICVGGGHITREEGSVLEVLGLSDKVYNFTQVSEAKLKELYSNALALIYPSLYEGFGMPLLEAMVNECPVLSSASSSLPEVGGDAALYFNATSADSIIEVVQTFLTESKTREMLIKKGSERVQNFSWQKASEKLTQIYSSIS